MNFVYIGLLPGGGGGGVAPSPPPPQLQKILKFFGQNADDSGRSAREKAF